MRVLVTGALGFIGKHLRTYLERYGCEIIGLDKAASKDEVSKNIFRADILKSDLANFLCDTDVVIHLAGRVHIMRETSSDPLSEYREINVDGTIRLANAAIKAGVKRFIYLSSAKVNGETSLPNKPFKEEDQPNPSDPYSVSKFEAEVYLRSLFKGSDMDVIIIRPPLVYGPGVKANFAELIKWIERGFPIPLGCVKSNKRSFVSVANLVDFIRICLNHQKASNEIFFVSDDEDISTAELVKRLAKAMQKRAKLLPVPVSFLKCGAMIINKRQYISRLLDSLQVDITKAKSLLGWKPPQNLDEALRQIFIIK
jgi:nucleoside-diphosphate-sugar epimerase